MLPQQRLQQQRLQQKIGQLNEVNKKWVSAAPGVPLQTTHVRNIDVHSQNEGALLGELQLYILGQYTDFKKAMDVWTNFSQIYSYDTPFDEEAFMDEMGEPLDRKDVTYQNILDYWINFIEQRRSELETPRTPITPRTITDTDSSVLDGGRKSSKKKPKKASKKKSKKARKSSRNTMVRKKSRGH